MDDWPRVDPDVRRRLLAEVRRRRIRDATHGLTPAERLARADELRRFASAVARPCGGPERDLDEPAEMWLRMLARFRAAPGRAGDER